MVQSHFFFFFAIVLVIYVRHTKADNLNTPSATDQHENKLKDGIDEEIDINQQVNEQMERINLKRKIEEEAYEIFHGKLGLFMKELYVNKKKEKKVRAEAEKAAQLSKFDFGLDSWDQINEKINIRNEIENKMIGELKALDEDHKNIKYKMHEAFKEYQEGLDHDSVRGILEGLRSVNSEINQLKDMRSRGAIHPKIYKSRLLMIKNSLIKKFELPSTNKSRTYKPAAESR